MSFYLSYMKVMRDIYHFLFCKWGTKGLRKIHQRLSNFKTPGLSTLYLEPNFLLSFIFQISHIVFIKKYITVYWISDTYYVSWMVLDFQHTVVNKHKWRNKWMNQNPLKNGNKWNRSRLSEEDKCVELMMIKIYENPVFPCAWWEATFSSVSTLPK